MISTLHFIPQPGIDDNIPDKGIVKQYYKAPSPNDFKDLKRKCSPFLLFRKKVNEAIQKSGRVRSAGNISKIAAELWEETPPNEKEIYNRLSRQNVVWLNTTTVQQPQTQIAKVVEPKSFSPSIQQPQMQIVKVAESESITSPIQQPETSIPKVDKPEFFIYSKDVWTNEESRLFGVPL
ncbi:4417_t:CDS:1 [Ambispora gerdemannii]|uniref:4417_t:CDS:1 n=1 Tax=Ambispora gerdemannii TaxID=144530 RepID=A0A9N8V4C3_9GLOM|nr:4417_t:CDS:1 [Ambispora gerdemannii]